MEAMLVSAGMSAATAATTATVIQGVGTGLSLLSGISAGFQQKAAYAQQAEGAKEQAYMEKLKAGEDANLRRERLLQALAAQTAQAGARGVTGGTPAAMQLESTEAFQREQRGADVMAKAQQSKYQRDAAGYKKQGQAALTGSLLSFGTQLSQV